MINNELQIYQQLTKIGKNGIRIPLFPASELLKKFEGSTYYNTSPGLVGARYILARMAGETRFIDFLISSNYGKYPEYPNQKKDERYMPTKMSGLKFIEEFTTRILYFAKMQMKEGVIIGGKENENENFDRISYYTQVKGITRVESTNNGDRLKLTPGGAMLVDSIKNLGGSTLVNSVHKGSAFILSAQWEARARDQNLSSIEIAGSYNGIIKETKSLDNELKPDHVDSFRQNAACISGDDFVDGFDLANAGVESYTFNNTCFGCQMRIRCGALVSNLYDTHIGKGKESTAKAIEPQLYGIRHSITQ
jgi:hypothetical protein